MPISNPIQKSSRNFNIYDLRTYNDVLNLEKEVNDFFNQTPATYPALKRNLYACLQSVWNTLPKDKSITQKDWIANTGLILLNQPIGISAILCMLAVRDEVFLPTPSFFNSVEKRELAHYNVFNTHDIFVYIQDKKEELKDVLGTTHSAPLVLEEAINHKPKTIKAGDSKLKKSLLGVPKEFLIFNTPSKKTYEHVVQTKQDVFIMQSNDSHNYIMHSKTGQMVLYLLLSKISYELKKNSNSMQIQLPTVNDLMKTMGLTGCKAYHKINEQIRYFFNTRFIFLVGEREYNFSFTRSSLNKQDYIQLESSFIDFWKQSKLMYLKLNWQLIKQLRAVGLLIYIKSLYINIVAKTISNLTAGAICYIKDIYHSMKLQISYIQFCKQLKRYQQENK